MLVSGHFSFSSATWKRASTYLQLQVLDRGYLNLSYGCSAVATSRWHGLRFAAAHSTSYCSQDTTNLRLRLSDGISLAAKVWGKSGRPILALHGWLDNANSFHFLGPQLAAKGFFVVAIDWPGHGLSAHRSKDAHYSVTELPWYALQTIRSLGWEHQFALLGHSMGAGASTMLAASCYPTEQSVAALCCIEVLGPLSAPSSKSAKHLRRYLQEREKYLNRMSTGYGQAKKIYESFDACVQARLRSLQVLPGDMRLTLEAATYLVKRGAKETSPGQWSFLHDPRLKTPSPRYYTEEQVLELIRSICAPTLIIEAEPQRGHFSFRSATSWNTRLEAVKHRQHLILPGGHHLHLDPDTVPGVSAAILEFYSKQAALQDNWHKVSLEMALSAGTELL